MNRSHIQININKLLDYLRSLEKFNPRNLWSNNEICSGDLKTIFELLDDIWNFYSNKIFYKPIRRKSKFKENSFSSTNIYNTNLQPSKNNTEMIDSKRRENSINSLYINNQSQKNSLKEIDKIKEINIFSPISKHDEEKETKNIYQSTNSDILNCLIEQNELRSNNKINIKRGICL